MPNTFTLISSQTLASPAASITFSSIPATYTDLKIFMSAKSNDSVAQGQYMFFNGVNSSVSSKYLIGDGSSPATGSLTYMYIASIFGTNGTANAFNNTEIYIPNAFGTAPKIYSTDGGAENNGTTAYTNIITGLSSNTTSAITSITISTQGSSSMITGSTFYLYGIKNS